MTRWYVRGFLTVCCDVELEVEADTEHEAFQKAELEIRLMDPDYDAVDALVDRVAEIQDVELIEDSDRGGDEIDGEPVNVGEDRRMRALGCAMLPGVES